MKIGPMVVLTINSGTFTTSSPGTQVYEAIFVLPTALIPDGTCSSNVYLVMCKNNTLNQDCKAYFTNSSAQINFESAISGVYGQLWAATGNQVQQCTLVYTCLPSSSL